MQKTYACIEWNEYYGCWIARVEAEDYRNGSNIYADCHVEPGFLPTTCTRDQLIAWCRDQRGHEIVDTRTMYMHKPDEAGRPVFDHVEHWPAQ